MKNKLIILFVLFVFTLYSENSGIYSVVTLPVGKFLQMKKEPKVFSSILGKIPSDYDVLKTTWKTQKVNDDYWIQCNYDGLVGWVNREFLTNYDLDTNGIDANLIDTMLYNVTKSFQKGSFSDLGGLLYPLRGLGLYSYSVGNVTFYTTESLEKGWIYYTNKKFSGGASINYYLESINTFLFSKFEIIPVVAKGDKKIHVDIMNFNYVKAVNDKEELYIGLEKWNNKIYIAYLALIRK